MKDNGFSSSEEDENEITIHHEPLPEEIGTTFFLFYLLILDYGLILGCLLFTYDKIIFSIVNVFMFYVSF